MASRFRTWRLRRLRLGAAPAIKVGGEIKPPNMISSVLPVYPSIARSTGVEGNSRGGGVDWSVTGSVVVHESDLRPAHAAPGRSGCAAPMEVSARDAERRAGCRAHHGDDRSSTGSLLTLDVLMFWPVRCSPTDSRPRAVAFSCPQASNGVVCGDVACVSSEVSHARSRACEFGADRGGQGAEGNAARDASRRSGRAGDQGSAGAREGRRSAKTSKT